MNLGEISMKRMKKFLSILLSVIICSSMATISFATVTEKEGTIPGTTETY